MNKLKANVKAAKADETVWREKLLESQRRERDMEQLVVKDVPQRVKLIVGCFKASQAQGCDKDREISRLQDQIHQLKNSKSTDDVILID